MWLSSDSFHYYLSCILSPFRWTPIDTPSKACSIMKNYSSTEGREGILVNVTFVVNSLVILSKPNQRRILPSLRLITNRGGQQTLYIAIDHVWRQVYRVNTHSKWKMSLFFMTASCRKRLNKKQTNKQSFFTVCESCSSVWPFIRWTHLWEYLISAEKRSTFTPGQSEVLVLSYFCYRQLSSFTPIWYQ